MDAPHTRTTSAWHLWLFNPFHFLAGGQALAWGLACIALTAWLGGIFDFRFTGVISFQRTAPAPLWHAIAQGFMAWAIPSALLYIGGRLISRSRVRPIDVFGTQALARAPWLLIALIAVSPPFRSITAKLLTEPFLDLSAWGVAFISLVALVLILLLVWTVFLMYRAFAVSCNVASGRAIAVFIAAIAIGEIATGAAGRLLPGTAAPQPLTSAPVQSEQHHLAAQLATQILQAHEQGRFEALGPEAAEGFRKAFTAEIQRHSYQQLRQLFGTFEGLDFVETHSIESQPNLLIHRFRGRYSTASPEVRVVLDQDGKLTGLWIKPWQDQMQ
ncbi:MAG: hypothetical protein F4Y91_10155 [Gemmatimonadetes bacterium]|nr:hypothetical protein [Gemmatimonadota bacterium]MXY82407.1 hypothetical protein [Gemmatimonadota bacterium]MYB71914.1 hypothetical protein [Gemmatimonadota bacterium]